MLCNVNTSNRRVPWNIGSHPQRSSQELDDRLLPQQQIFSSSQSIWTQQRENFLTIPLKKCNAYFSWHMSRKIFCQRDFENYSHLLPIICATDITISRRVRKCKCFQCNLNELYHSTVGSHRDPTVNLLYLAVCCL